MILICDVDGCLTEGRNQPVDLRLAAELRTVLKEKSIKLILASGRSQSYMECMCQVFNLNTPYICENGASVFCPKAGKYVYKVEKSDIHELKSELTSVFKNDIIYEPNKEFSLSFRLDNRTNIENEVKDVLSAITLPDNLHLTHSNSAIDITPVGCSKGRAMKWLLTEFYADESRVIAGFGDAENDLNFLEQCQISGAPANCSGSVKEIAGFVSEKRSIEGLLDFVNQKLI